MEVTAKFLELLLAGASREDLDLVVAEAGVSGTTPEQLESLRQQHALAVRIHEQMARQRSREAELSGLYETARDLTGIRDLDAILAAIVRRARQLLGADMTYLSLNDEEEGASYMKVTDGALTPEFRTLRLPLGTGLLGLVAQTGEPYFTADYQADERFLHADYIDSAVAGEQIRAILGVPLMVDGAVIGALLAVHRSIRAFPASEVALLTSFAAHAAVALENARLFEQVRAAVAAADGANAELQARSDATERAAHAHDLLTDVLLHGGGVVEVAGVLAQVLGGELSVYDDEGRLLTGADTGMTEQLDAAITEARTSGRCVRMDGGAWVAAAAAGDEHLGTLVLRTDESLDLLERRTLERGALVVALVLLFMRSEAEAESKVRGELLVDLVSGRDLDADRLRERARQQGADLDGDLAIAVAEPDAESESGVQAARVASSLAREVNGLGGVHEGKVVVLAPQDPLRLGGQLCSRLDVATVGVASSSGGVERIPAAWREARQILTTLVRLGRTGEVSDPAGLGLARLLLGGNGPEELEEFVSHTLGPVLDYDAGRDTRLVETLDAWFAAGGSLRATAERLHIHPNTVTQRLERVGQLLGDHWREPGRALDVQLALQMVRLRRTM
ncbi:helix-turn-helix domain-containing protein [Aeromicrobium sp.]|uniref:helix-turn-helix domain-containing protein n=1 Tax=Aeromicrobium sp. TaxID=1871063 RepID=UPI003D6C596B